MNHNLHNPASHFASSVPFSLVFRAPSVQERFQLELLLVLPAAQPVSPSQLYAVVSSPHIPRHPTKQ